MNISGLNYYYITSLKESDKEAIVQHFLGLSEKEKQLRFFTCWSDYFIKTTVITQMFKNPKGCIFGAFKADGTGKGKLVGTCQLGFTENEGTGQLEAELALSVDKLFPKSGIGKAFMQKGIEVARSNGFKELIVTCLPEDHFMINLAKQMGAQRVDDIHKYKGSIPLF